MTYDISITHEFPVPREVVFDGWTNPATFAAWFGTEVVRVPLNTLVWTATPGDTWSARMVLPDGGTIDWTGEFIDVTIPETIEFTITDVPSSPDRGTVTVRFEPTESGTHMIMRQWGESMSQQDAEGAAAGWGAFFDDLEQLVTR